MSLFRSACCFPIVLLVGAVVFASPIRVSAAEDETDENRYEIIKEGKDRLKIDKRNGDMFRLEKDEDGAYIWVKVAVPVRVSQTQPTKAKTKLTAPEIQLEDSAQITPAEERRRRRNPAPDIFDDNGNNIAEVITDFDRRQSEATIAMYEKHLSVCNAVQIGDRIAGTFLIKNKGEKKIKVLELTMSVPVVGRDKPEEHRFLFIDKPGSSTLPPQPSNGGREAEALLQKVDIACPAGHARGNADLKVTYLKLAE